AAALRERQPREARSARPGAAPGPGAGAEGARTDAPHAGAAPGAGAGRGPSALGPTPRSDSDSLPSSSVKVQPGAERAVLGAVSLGAVRPLGWSHQRVISTGPYAIVRHPMYAGGLAYVLGTPLALGSYVGFLAFGLMLPFLIWRLLDEERLLGRELPGYAEYQARVRYRLLPYLC